MQRILEPELLDSLAPEDPDALHSRRDLRLTNQILGNHRWLTRTLRKLLRAGDVALELGAGTGELGQRLGAHGLAVDAIDRWPRPEQWPKARAWHVADLREFNGYEGYPVVFGNLIFHHFGDHELGALGGVLQRHARAIVACEPARRRTSQKLFAAIAPLFRAHPVTLHDARLSIAAGFVGGELPRALGLSPAAWDCRCTTTLLGAYQMVAIRRG
ncbi:MAG: hypothetical protein ABIZ81_07515 [Opitutaceae bacterium]